MNVSLSAIKTYLDAVLGSERFPGDEAGIYLESARPVQRIGLALEPWPGMASWIREKRLDAIFLHRPWRLHRATFPDGIGVLSYHLAFDAALTFGFNLRLAAVLHLREPMPFALKAGVPQGMLGTIQETPLEDLVIQLAQIFGKVPAVEMPQTETVRCVAVVGAMHGQLVRRAAASGVQLYITGQYRPQAAEAVWETSMTVAVVGHAEGERWGLRALAGLLRERWDGLEVMLAPQS